MSEWWTYRLSDFQMYSAHTFTRLFETYNEALFPAQFPALALGAWLTWVAWRGSVLQLRVASALLGVCWAWVAWAFFWKRLALIDLAGAYYAGAFAFESVLLLSLAWWLRQMLAPQESARRLGATSVGIAVFGLPLVAPLLSGEAGAWRAVALFGLTPDATAFATLGLIASLGSARWLASIPVLWCAISGGLLWNLDAPHALVAPVFAGPSLIAILWRERLSRPRQVG